MIYYELHGYKRDWARQFIRWVYEGCGVVQGSRLVEKHPNAIDPNAPGPPTGLDYADAGDILAVLWRMGLIERGAYRPSAVDIVYGREKPPPRRRKAVEKDYMGPVPLSHVGRPHLEALGNGVLGEVNGAGLPAYVWHEVPEQRARAWRFAMVPSL